MKIAARHALWTALRGGVLVLVGVVLTETFLLDGLVTSYRVHGGSMADALLGTHREVVCDDCRCRFACDSDSASPPVRAVCPNCGYAGNEAQTLPDVMGDRVLIDRAAFALRAPRRWEPVALRSTSASDWLLVKRIVGLPGESIEIRSGDVYIDSGIARKDLAQQRAMAVMVYDASFVPSLSSEAPARWRPERADSGWSTDGGVFRHSAATDRRSPDWLVYHHWQRMPSAATQPISEFRESPITDLSGYNQSEPRREEDVRPVTDLMLSLRVHCHSGGGLFAVRMGSGSRVLEARLRYRGEVLRDVEIHDLRESLGIPIASIRAGGSEMATCDVPVSAGERLVEVSTTDRQFLLAVDGQTLAVQPYDRSEPQSPPTACPVAIAAEGIDITLRDVSLYRDVYYNAPPPLLGSAHRQKRTLLGPSEYYVLGDNSPVSDDSRIWPEGGAVDAKLLMGKPFVSIPATLITPWRDRHFQVPNLSAIRYIR